MSGRLVGEIGSGSSRLLMRARRLPVRGRSARRPHGWDQRGHESTDGWQNRGHESKDAHLWWQRRGWHQVNDSLPWRYGDYKRVDVLRWGWYSPVGTTVRWEQREHFDATKEGHHRNDDSSTRIIRRAPAMRSREWRLPCSPGVVPRGSVARVIPTPVRMTRAGASLRRRVSSLFVSM